MGLASNIRYFRKQNKLTQQTLADKLQVKRSQVGAWEEDRATPKLEMLTQLASLFGTTVDVLITFNAEPELPTKTMPQVLTVVVDKDNNEQIPIVPVKASAGYLNGLSDPEYIENLPCFSMPIPELSPEKTHRVFQIKGDSMLPILPNSYIFCEYVNSVSDVRAKDAYILITREEGLVFKRVTSISEKFILLESDNKEYEPYHVDLSNICEIWKAKGVLSFNLPEPDHSNRHDDVMEVLKQIKEDVSKLRVKN